VTRWRAAHTSRLEAKLRLIRSFGWAFFLSLALTVACFANVVLAQLGESSPGSGQETIHEHENNLGGTTDKGPHWEGSPEGIAYSERNHHLAGIAVILIGLIELREALLARWLAWSRFLAPAALFGAGAFLLIWSDHGAWPIGSMSFAESFFGHDHEIIQHKTYGILLCAVGIVEALRRAGRLVHAAWRLPLPVFAIIGGAILFMHSHGAHPSAQKIALHHAVMQTLAVLAGSCRLVSMSMAQTAARGGASKLDLLWAVLILAIGLQLLCYSE